MRVILIGKSSGRLDCLAETILRSRATELFILTNLSNSGLRAKGFVITGPTEDPDFVTNYTSVLRDGVPTIAVISNEEPLAAGVVDRLLDTGIPVVGPTKAAAQIETSKIFMRMLLGRFGLNRYSPAWAAFELADAHRIEGFIRSMNTLGFQAVIKPDGLTGGKGVRVQGEHLETIDEAITYCAEIFAANGRVLIETRLEGQEFSRMAFCDGQTVIPMPAAQDHKRLGEGDIGVNTGGMGCYSDIDHSLPFLTANDLHEADQLNRSVVQAIAIETGQPYVGILYGNFIATKQGISLIEYNARFGDPEAMMLSLLETDFVDLCCAMVSKRLRDEHVRFARRASVCKYLLPTGYPTSPCAGRIDLSGVEPHPDLRIYYGALDGDEMTGSRALALVGLGDSIFAAEAIAERAAEQVQGPTYHRRDIGTTALIQHKVEHLRQIRATGSGCQHQVAPETA